MVQQLFNIGDAIWKMKDAGEKFELAHLYGEKPENRISDNTRIALSAAKLRAGEVGITDEELASRRGQLANMETGLGFSTDYNELYGAYDKAGIDPGSVGQNVTEGIQSANALAGMRYEGSGEQLANETSRQSERVWQNYASLVDQGIGSGGMGGSEFESPGSSGASFKDVGGGSVVIDNNYGMSTPDYSSVYGGTNVIDNNFGVSEPQQAGIPDYLSNPTPEIQSTSQQDIVSMLLNLLNKNKPRA